MQSKLPVEDTFIRASPRQSYRLVAASISSPAKRMRRSMSVVSGADGSFCCSDVSINIVDCGGAGGTITISAAMRTLYFRQISFTASMQRCSASSICACLGDCGVMILEAWLFIAMRVDSDYHEKKMYENCNATVGSSRPSRLAP